MNTAEVEQTASTCHQSVWCHRGWRCCRSTIRSSTQQQKYHHSQKTGGGFGGGVKVSDRKKSQRLQIPAAWKTERKFFSFFFCECALSLKFPWGSGAEITQCKQEKERAEKRGKLLKRGEEAAVDCRGLQTEVCTVLPGSEEDGKAGSLKGFPISSNLTHAVHTKRRGHDETPSKVSPFSPLTDPPEYHSFCSTVSVCCVLPPSVNDTVSITRIPSSHFHFSPHAVWLTLVGAFSPLPRNQVSLTPPFLSSSDDKKISNPFLWLVLTPLDFWVCARGRDKRQRTPPPLFFPSLLFPFTDHWALFTAGLLQVLSPNWNGIRWGWRPYVTFYGPEGGGWE